jgi:tight adherence protein B
MFELTDQEIAIFIAILVIPFIVVLLSYVIFNIYQESNKQNIMISILSDSSNYILNKKKDISKNKTKESPLAIKLNHAGYMQDYAVVMFIIISIGFGILSGAFVNFIANSPIIFIITTLIFSFFPYLALLKIIATRQDEFNYGLKAIIDKVTSMMKSGVGFEQAFRKAIVTSKSEFTKEILGIYLSQKDIIGEDKAFEKMFKLVESRELRIFYLVVTIGRQSGGKFSNTLETLRQTLQDQGTIKQEIVSSTKEIKIGTYLIIALTVGIYFMMNSIFNNGLNEYFFGTNDGKVQMFFIIIWVAFGIFVNNMMTKIKG